MSLQQLLAQRDLPTSGKDVEQFDGGVDFIGDVHGCYDSLEALLKALGYVHDGDCFRYAGTDGPRKVVFVGDLVDRGPRIRDVLHCVHAMVEHGEAQLVMGNHEFHALSYYIPTREDSTGFIRAHTTKNYELLQETIAAFDGLDDEWAYLREWLLDRPIFIEHPNYRVVHACWDQEMIDQYRARFQRNTIDREFVLDFADRSGFSYAFLERCMRGIELSLPDGVFIKGTDGTLRDNFRARFWLENPKTYDEVIFRKYMLPDEMVGVPLSSSQLDSLCLYAAHERPLFVGHYWRTGDPQPITTNIACVDYSAVRQGQLMAYRFDGEAELSAHKFLGVDCQDTVAFLPERKDIHQRVTD